MALTAKPISTISYNTEEFLERTLNRLFQAHIITDYRYIFHYGEDGDKDHFHVLLYPNRRIDTGILIEEFKEIDPANVRPLSCLPFRVAQGKDAVGHWILYAVHDAVYLQNHQSDNDGDGKIGYKLDDIRTPYPEQLERDFKRALQLRRTMNQEAIERLINGQTLTQILIETQVSPMQVNAIFQAMKTDAQMSGKDQRQIESRRRRDMVISQIQALDDAHQEQIREQYWSQYENIDKETGEVKNS